jgi:hypothetical protein
MAEHLQLLFVVGAECHHLLSAAEVEHPRAPDLPLPALSDLIPASADGVEPQQW